MDAVLGLEMQWVVDIMSCSTPCLFVEERERETSYSNYPVSQDRDIQDIRLVYWRLNWLNEYMHRILG